VSVEGVAKLDFPGARAVLEVRHARLPRVPAPGIQR
jgi:hypothetical protein